MTTPEYSYNTIKWTALLKAIRAEKCILCIGPEVFTDATGSTLDAQIFKYLQNDGEIDDDVVVYPDGLFFFQRKNKRSHIIADLEGFYSKAFPQAEEIFRKIVHIPFNLIFFLTPDHKFAKIAADEERPYKRDFYFKGQPPQKTDKPSKINPLVYHLLGSIEADADESIILTYDDLYSFLESVFAGNSMSDELKKLIQDAKHVVCLGLPFGKWYMQLLLRVLKLHANDDSTKYASKPDVTDYKIYQEQFKFTFVPHNVEEFVNELLKKCQGETLVRESTAIIGNFLSPVEVIQGLIKDDKIQEALKEIEKEIKKSGQWGRFDNDIIEYQSRLRVLTAGKDHNRISNDEYLRQLGQIRMAILNFLKEALI